MEAELTEIKFMLGRKVYPEFSPKITYIAVNRRHHTRFFVANKRDDGGLFTQNILHNWSSFLQL